MNQPPSKSQTNSVQGPDRAVALGYDPEKDQSPRVLATGRGEIARRILELAHKNNIPVHQDASLVERLAVLELNEEIPPELYQIVAEVLVFLYKLDNRWKDKMHK